MLDPDLLIVYDESVLSKTDKKLFWLICVLIAIGSLVSWGINLILEFPSQTCDVITAKQKMAPGYAAREFILEQIPISEIKQASLFDTYPRGDLVYPFDGIPRVELSMSELAALRVELNSDILFDTPNSITTSYECFQRDEKNAFRATPCDGSQLWNSYEYYLGQSTRRELLLYIKLRDGRQAVVSIQTSPAGTIFVGRDGTNGIEGVVRGAAPALEALLSSPQETPIHLLWPELSAAEENSLANWLWGYAYQRSLDYINFDPKILDYLGAIKEIRLMDSTNGITTWDSNAEATFTFHLSGEKKNAVVRMNSKVFFLEFIRTLFLYGAVDYNPPVISGRIVLPGAQIVPFWDKWYPPQFGQPKYDIRMILRLRHLIVARYCQLIGR